MYIIKTIVVLLVSAEHGTAKFLKAFSGVALGDGHGKWAMLTAKWRWQGPPSSPIRCDVPRTHARATKVSASRVRCHRVA